MVPVSSSAGSLHSRFPLQLYVHCAISVEYLAELNAAIPGIDRYAERALLLAQRQDIVCLPEEIEPAYLAYLAELGLGPLPENVLVASRLGDSDRSDPLWQRILRSDAALDILSRRARQHGSAVIHPFVASHGPFVLADAIQSQAGVPVSVSGGDPALVAYADFKHHIRAHAIELGIPVAPGEVVDLGNCGEDVGCKESALIRSFQRQMPRTGRLIVRGTSGSGGSSTFALERLEQGSDLARLIALRTDNSIYLVESMVQGTVSPNVQMHVDAESRVVTCAGVTDQRWDRPLVHGGNQYPSCARRLPEMIGWAHMLAEWLGSQGYSGLLGLDFVEYHDAAGIPQAFLAEVNPRTNGATYPLSLMNRLNSGQREAQFPEIRAFTSGTVEIDALTFPELQEEWNDLLFSRSQGRGLILSVPGLMTHGKCGVVAFAETREEADRLFEETSVQAGAL